MTNKKCSGKRCPLDSTAYNEDCTAVDHCKWFTPKIVTNRQWLESLSDEKLAGIVTGFVAGKMIVLQDDEVDE